MTQGYQEKLARPDTVPSLPISQFSFVAKADHQAKATSRDRRPYHPWRTKTPTNGRSPVRHAARVHPTGSRIDGLNAILTAHRPHSGSRRILGFTLSVALVWVGR